jgi:hypothetical protein
MLIDFMPKNVRIEPDITLLGKSEHAEELSITSYGKYRLEGELV